MTNGFGQFVVKRGYGKLLRPEEVMKEVDFGYEQQDGPTTWKETNGDGTSAKEEEAEPPISSGSLVMWFKSESEHVRGKVVFMGPVGTEKDAPVKIGLRLVCERILPLNKLVYFLLLAFIMQTIIIVRSFFVMCLYFSICFFNEIIPLFFKYYWGIVWMVFFTLFLQAEQEGPMDFTGSVNDQFLFHCDSGFGVLTDLDQLMPVRLYNEVFEIQPNAPPNSKQSASDSVKVKDRIVWIDPKDENKIPQQGVVLFIGNAAGLSGVQAGVEFVSPVCRFTIFRVNSVCFFSHSSVFLRANFVYFFSRFFLAQWVNIRKKNKKSWNVKTKCGINEVIQWIKWWKSELIIAVIH